MNDLAPRPLDIPLPDGALRALRWGDGDRVLLTAHGITGTGASWQAIARFLPADWTLIAVDLRGRGGSAHLPGPHGLARHAVDLLAAADHLAAQGNARPTLAGHSLGAYVALLAADARPEAFERLVLLDGGLPLPLPEGLDPKLAVSAILGPAFARLQQTYTDAEEYLAFWRAHPALADCWNPDIEAYLRYDLVGEPGALRSGVGEAAVLADGTDLIAASPRFGDALRALRLPTLLLTATSGMYGKPPGLLPDEVVAHWTREAPLRADRVPDTNHYSILMDHRSAGDVAKRICVG
ncbi:alpha/beta hydrolase [Catenulispora subtropica]|uniref:AB hydrolase-1 domain-containing protein n=1 Tax=Catenulispora subtropica TaxID=450798 RepID=A0ABN2T5D3_9ACTN